jgi:hypothetical protein
LSETSSTAKVRGLDIADIFLMALCALLTELFMLTAPIRIEGSLSLISAKSAGETVSLD